MAVYYACMITPVGQSASVRGSNIASSHPPPMRPNYVFSTLTESRPRRIWQSFWNSAFMKGIRRKGNIVLPKIYRALAPGWEWIKKKVSPIVQWIKENLLFFLFDPKEEERAALYKELETFIRATIHSKSLDPELFYPEYLSLSEGLQDRIRWHVGKRIEKIAPGKEENFYKKEVIRLMKEEPYGGQTYGKMVVQDVVLHGVRLNLSRWY
ncbi:MAG: hypothetical protein KR126chlam1_01065 [Chlamydiae bacterium]|nr:hypothetical protein [Chlamydiota bacterium]